MSFRFTLAVALALVATSVSAQERGGKKTELKTLRDKASYSFGMTMGTRLKKQDVDIDVELLVQGLRDGVGGGKLAMTEEQAMEAMTAFEQAVSKKQEEENKRFLVDNKKRPGVKTTESGLQYKIIKPGKGARPKLSDNVQVVYRGTFVNGEEFDSSGNKPFTIGVDNVILGWKEALQIMEVGSKWQLFVPADLAYGEQGYPPAIGPNATLIFDIELLGIEKPGAAQGKSNTQKR